MSIGPQLLVCYDAVLHLIAGEAFFARRQDAQFVSHLVVLADFQKIEGAMHWESLAMNLLPFTMMITPV